MWDNFLLKSYRKWGRETSFRPLLVFLKKPLWGKSKACTLVLIYDDRPRLERTKKTNYVKI